MLFDIPESYDLFDWTGRDKAGNSKKYQTAGPGSCTEAEMREHLARSYPNLVITSIERKPQSAYKQPTGIVERHAFTAGIIGRVERELGYQTVDDFRHSLLEYGRKVRNGNPRDARDFGVHIQRQYEQALTDARDRARSTPQRPAFGVGRSLLIPTPHRSK